MALLDPSPLIEHVVRFGGFGVAGAVGGDVVPDIGEQVCAVAGLFEGGALLGEGLVVGGEEVAVPREVGLF